MNSVIEHLRRAAMGEGAGLGDGELLGCFIERHDEAALTALVKRHGPMVWGVCRRLLSHHDAEDAFQATFLVLVRKAASIVPREMVGNWLYGVAHQTALQARRTAARRRAREVQMPVMPETEAVQQDQWTDVQPLLDQELSHLPNIYRAVVVLCDLEGRTRKEVARQLGVPEGTVAGRLARARSLLAKRLSRRGVAFSGGALAALVQNVAPAGVPDSVVASTIKAASLLAAGKAATSGAISVKVAALTEGVMKAMLFTKLKIATVMLLVAGVALSAGVFSVMSMAKEPRSAPAQQQGSKKTMATDQKKIQGAWKMTYAEVKGLPLPPNKIAALKLVFKGDKHILYNGEKIEAMGSHRLDPAKKQKAIDITEEEGPNKGKSTRGIYLLDDDVFTVCYNTPDMARPTAFTSKAGSTIYLFIYKRVAP